MRLIRMTDDVCFTCGCSELVDGPTGTTDDQRTAARALVVSRVAPADRALMLGTLGLDDLAQDRKDVA